MDRTWNVRASPTLDAARGSVSRARYVRALLERWHVAGYPLLPIITDPDWQAGGRFALELPIDDEGRLLRASGGSMVAAVAALVEWGSR